VVVDLSFPLRRVASALGGVRHLRPGKACSPVALAGARLFHREWVQQRGVMLKTVQIDWVAKPWKTWM
jgi:hypothetical protein